MAFCGLGRETFVFKPEPMVFVSAAQADYDSDLQGDRKDWETEDERQGWRFAKSPAHGHERFPKSSRGLRGIQQILVGTRTKIEVQVSASEAQLLSRRPGALRLPKSSPL